MTGRGITTGMTAPGWDHLSHGADIGVRGRGWTLNEAFEQAALALTAVVTNPERVRADTEVHITCEAPDPELLLVEWLNGVIYEMASRKMLFGRFEVSTSEGRALHASAWGETVDCTRHEPAVEPKGATYTGLSVRQKPNGEWEAACIVDV